MSSEGITKSTSEPSETGLTPEEEAAMIAQFNKCRIESKKYNKMRDNEKSTGWLRAPRPLEPFDGSWIVVSDEERALARANLYELNSSFLRRELPPPSVKLVEGAPMSSLSPDNMDTQEWAKRNREIDRRVYRVEKLLMNLATMRKVFETMEKGAKNVDEENMRRIYRLLLEKERYLRHCLQEDRAQLCDESVGERDRLQFIEANQEKLDQACAEYDRRFGKKTVLKLPPTVEVAVTKPRSFEEMPTIEEKAEDAIPEVDDFPPLPTMSLGLSDTAMWVYFGRSKTLLSSEVKAVEEPPMNPDLEMIYGWK